MVMIAVCGAGPHGRELAEVARAIGHDIVLLDDDPDVPSAGPLSLLSPGDRWVAGAAWPLVRRQVLARVPRGRPAAVLIHPAATTGKGTHYAEGVVVAAGAHIGIDSVFAEHAHVGMGATVSRDAHIGACVTICPGAHIAGGVTVEDDAFIGIGAIVSHELVIGTGALVGAGAVVVEDVKPFEVVVGNPARPR